MQNDTTKFDESPIEVAPRIWWVGHVLKNDPFQCHAYLIEQGDQSVLVDPGSLLTFETTLRKVKDIIPFDNIRYIICQHQDPDIAASLPIINTLVTREDAAILCHGRAAALLKHYKLDIPMQLIEDMDWSLTLEDRTLDFIFTPYAHFPGAFCTFDNKSGSLFSSDLFGGLTENFSLYAQDENYFEAMRPFHEHYIPSNAILRHAIESIKKFPVTQIMPQHGSIIPPDLVESMMSRMMELECGIFLDEPALSEVIRLSEINKILREINDLMILSKDFKSIAAGLLTITQKFLPVTSFEFYSLLHKDQYLHLTQDDYFCGEMSVPPYHLRKLISISMVEWYSKRNMDQDMDALPIHKTGENPCLVLPLSNDDMNVTGVAVIHLSEPLVPGSSMNKIVSRFQAPLQVAVERETMLRAMDMERQHIYERASRDPLTNLYTRFYMQDTVQRILDLQKRDKKTSMHLAMIDIDHFKRINDNYGHNAGDTALREIAKIIIREIRSSDLPVRLGGEEFGIFLAGTTLDKAINFSERLRLKIERFRHPEPIANETLTVSIGLAEGRIGDTLECLIERADKALYRAKNKGRNQLQMADVDYT
ncbi:MAG: diguanylate cyclase [Desulfocapsa sp.]|nr:diguanylate cyclase [Desulfocapsa sp.]